MLKINFLVEKKVPLITFITHIPIKHKIFKKESFILIFLEVQC